METPYPRCVARVRRWVLLTPDDWETVIGRAGLTPEESLRFTENEILKLALFGPKTRTAEPWEVREAARNGKSQPTTHSRITASH